MHISQCLLTSIFKQICSTEIDSITMLVTIAVAVVADNQAKQLRYCLHSITPNHNTLKKAEKTKGILYRITPILTVRIPIILPANTLAAMEIQKKILNLLCSYLHNSPKLFLHTRRTLEFSLNNRSKQEHLNLTSFRSSHSNKHIIANHLIISLRITQQHRI